MRASHCCGSLGALLCLLLVGACSDDTKAPDKSVANPDRGTPDVSKFPKSEGPSTDATNKVDAKKPDGPKTDAASPCKVIGPPEPFTSTGVKNKADILFVIDDSSEMAVGQTALVSHIAALETALKAASTDFHLGVVTTDLGAGSYAIPQCTPCGHNGQLHVDDTTVECGFWFMLEHYIHGIPSYPMQTVFKCIGKPGESGCGFEQPLESAAVFLTNTKTYGPKASGFLRPDASLVLVFVTNEDDCSTKDPTLFNPADTTLGAMTSFRCFQHGITCDVNGAAPGPRTNCKPVVGGKLRDIAEYVTLFKSMKLPSRVSVVTIAGPTTPVTVSLESGNPKLDYSCTLVAGAFAAAAPAIRLKAFTDAFGADGKFHTYCGGFAAAIQDIASFAKNK